MKSWKNESCFGLISFNWLENIFYPKPNQSQNCCSFFSCILVELIQSTSAPLSRKG